MYQKTELSSFWRPRTSLDAHNRFMTSLLKGTPDLQKELQKKSEKTLRFHNPKTAYGLSNNLNDIASKSIHGHHLIGCYLSDWHIDDNLPPWSMCYILASDGHRIQTRTEPSKEHLTPELEPGDVVSFNLHEEHGLTPALARPHHSTFTTDEQRADYFSSLTKYDYFIAISQDIKREPTKKDLIAFRARILKSRENPPPDDRRPD